MALTYGFYNSVSGDRLYSAEQMSSIFEGMIHDGIFEDIDDKLEVVATTGMNVKVGKGRAWFNKTWTKNDSDIILTVDTAEVILKRIDVVVLEVDASVEVRTNTIKIVKGTPSSSPVATAMVATENVHQYPLARIFVEAGVTSILTADITSKIGTVDCPYVTGILRNIDTIVVDTITGGFEDLSEEVALQRTFFDNNIGQVGNKTTPIATTGSGSAYLVTYTENIPTAYTGLVAYIIASFDCSGPSTINFNSLDAKSLKKLTTNGKSALALGDMHAGNSYLVIYDGVDVVVMNPSSIHASLITSAGDLIYGSAANTPARLAKGTDGQILGLVNGLPAWQDKLTFVPISSASNGAINPPVGQFYTYTVSLGIEAKFAIVTISGAGVRFFKSFVIGLSGRGIISGTDQNMYATSAPDFGFGNNPATWQISLQSIFIDGTNLKILFYVSQSSGLYINVQGGAFA